jgi:AraC-like DNA-binding protein
LSRSALAERFTHLVGQPPMQYLANWRMQLAAHSLLSGSDSVAAIAERVGYESEAAFSRAFKKMVGVSPSQWRKQHS